MTVKAIDVGLQYAAATEHTTQAGYWATVTASGLVVAQPCQIIGFYVNTTAAGTIQFSDSAVNNGNPVGGVITPAVGMQWFPAIFLNGLFATVGGALNATIFYLK